MKTNTAPMNAFYYPGKDTCKFCPENIVKAQVWNSSEGKFDTCELWDDDDKEQCYRIADFNMSVSPTEICLFYANPIDYGVNIEEPNELIFIGPGVKQPVTLNRIGIIFLKRKYNLIHHMMFFGMYCNEFIDSVREYKESMQMKYQEKLEKLARITQVIVETNSDLPF